jgi:spore maturation protein CgeB
LAADPDLHAPVSLTEEDRRVFGCDVAFVGNWRPEREVLLAALSTRSNLDVKIWGGTSWEAPSRADRRVAKAWQKRLVLGADFAKACVGAKVNLNLIDPTNYPAANMRFFEIPSTGSLEVSSKCPEFQGDLRDRKHIFYYESAADLPSLLDALLTDEPLRSRVAAEGHRHVLENHTYRDRAQRIVELALGESKGAPARSGPADERIVSSS